MMNKQQLLVGDKVYKAIAPTHDFQLNTYEVTGIKKCGPGIIYTIKCLTWHTDQCKHNCDNCCHLDNPCKIEIEKSEDEQGFVFVRQLNNDGRREGKYFSEYELRFDKTLVNETHGGVKSNFHTTQYEAVKELLTHRIVRQEKMIEEDEAFLKKNFEKWDNDKDRIRIVIAKDSIESLKKDNEQILQKIKEYEGK